jgi:hypothetical protein
VCVCSELARESSASQAIHQNVVNAIEQKLFALEIECEEVKAENESLQKQLEEKPLTNDIQTGSRSIGELCPHSFSEEKNRLNDAFCLETVSTHRSAKSTEEVRLVFVRIRASLIVRSFRLRYTRVYPIMISMCINCKNK